MTPRMLNWHRIALGLVDLAILHLCIYGAFWLRFDGDIPASYWRIYLYTTPALACIFVATALLLGLYNRIWEYASADALLVIVAGATITFGLFGLVVMTTPLGYPRSVVAMSWGFAILAVAATRFAWRTLRRHLYHASTLPKADRVRALVYGAGQTGVMLVRQTRDDPQSHIEIVGFVDDDRCLQSMIIAGKRVLGTGDNLAELVARYNVDEIILALPSVAGTVIQRVMDQGRELGVRVRTVPRLLELLTGEDQAVSVRDVDLGDLIGRDTSCLNLALPDNYIEGRTILVTGAGGSIGSEICRQLCRYGPERVVLLGRGENRVHSIYYELTEKWPRIEFVPVIANITSREAMEEMFDRYRPAVVIHAAAHKHVYLMEVNAVEAARNNVLGTELVVNLASDYGVERFIFVSTDKAVEPTSVMGATKRLCERIVASRNGSSKTKFMAVRFGNVLGSAGSVVPIFQRCARMGRPLQVTHPDVDRFFMTILKRLPSWSCRRGPWAKGATSSSWTWESP